MEIKKSNNNSITIKLGDLKVVKLILLGTTILIIGLALIYYCFFYPPRQIENKCGQLVHDMLEDPFNQGKDMSPIYQWCLKHPSEILSSDPAINPPY